MAARFFALPLGCDHYKLKPNYLVGMTILDRAERILAKGLFSAQRSLIKQAFRLSAAALAEEPAEWPTQILARIQSYKVLTRHVQRSITASYESDWLTPIRSPLIAAGGPIDEIVNVGWPYDESRALIWSKYRNLVTSFRNASFRTWDLSLGKETRRLDLPIEWGRAAISDPPSLAVVMASQRQLLLVNLENATAEVIFNGPVLECVAISGDGAWAVTTGVPPEWDYSKHDWNGPRTLRLFDLKQQSCVRSWGAHRAVIVDLALSYDGRYLATASRDQTARLFDLANQTIVGTWRSSRGLVAIALSPSGRRLAYTSRGGILTVRRFDGGIVGRFNHCAAEPGCLALSKGGGKIVAGSGGALSVIDVNKGIRHGPFSGTQPNLSSLVIDEGAKRALTGELGTQLVLWDLTKIRKRGSSGQWISGIWAGAEEALIHQDGLSLWTLATGHSRQIVKPGSYAVTASPGARVWAIERWAASGGATIRVGVFGRKSSKLLLASRDLSLGMLTSAQLSRNGKRLLALVHRTGCRVLNMADSSTVWQLDELGLGVRAFLSPSGRYVALCSLGGQTSIVDLDTTKVVRRGQLQPHAGNVLFGADDQSIFIEQELEVVTWNWMTNSSCALCAGRPSSLSEDGNWLVTESNSRKLTLWQLPDQRKVATYTLDVPVSHTAVSPDGRFLIAGDQNGNVHILSKERGLP